MVSGYLIILFYCVLFEAGTDVAVSNFTETASLFFRCTYARNSLVLLWNRVNVASARRRCTNQPPHNLHGHVQEGLVSCVRMQHAVAAVAAAYDVFQTLTQNLLGIGGSGMRHSSIKYKHWHLRILRFLKTDISMFQQWSNGAWHEHEMQHCIYAARIADRLYIFAKGNGSRMTRRLPNYR